MHSRILTKCELCFNISISITTKPIIFHTKNVITIFDVKLFFEIANPHFSL